MVISCVMFQTATKVRKTNFFECFFLLVDCLKTMNKIKQIFDCNKENIPF